MSSLPSAVNEREVVAVLAARTLGTALLTVERVPEGVSTRVYRIRRGTETFYLRVLPEDGAGFAPEACVHTLLRGCGVRVPGVIYLDDCDEHLQRSVMITTEIPGRPIDAALPDEQIRTVIRDAGRQLALINTVAVDGFGWVRRDRAGSDRIAAEHASFRAFVMESLGDDLAALESILLPSSQVDAVRMIVERHQNWLDAEQGLLAHGDFDATPIFQKDGHYTGIIDFGEIRGADLWYDLGHFRMHDGGTLPAAVLDSLVEGYRDVTPLPADARERICFAALLIAIRALARQLRKRPHRVHEHQALVSIPRDLAVLTGASNLV